jgi:hypothetical protein
VTTVNNKILFRNRLRLLHDSLLVRQHAQAMNMAALATGSDQLCKQRSGGPYQHNLPQASRGDHAKSVARRFATAAKRIACLSTPLPSADHP